MTANRVFITLKTQGQFNKVLEVFKNKGWTPLNDEQFSWKTYGNSTYISYENNWIFSHYGAERNFYGTQFITFNEFLEMESKEGYSYLELIKIKVIKLFKNKKPIPHQYFKIMNDNFWHMGL